ncbi:MAG: imidazolonepropionase [Candidatus Dormibacteria bacterium]
MRALRNVGRLFSPGEPVRTDVDVLIAEGLVAAVVPAGTGHPSDDDFDCQGGLLTPGLIDAHSHPLYLRPRLEEVARRAAGSTYSEISREGGGIHATVRDTRLAPLEAIEESARSRFSRWLAQGTTTLEAKTGYWLEREGELQGLALLSRLGQDRDLPHLVPTYLAAHEVPLESRADRRGYVQAVQDWGPAAANGGAVFCDVFCDQGAFTVEESEAILVAGRTAGLKLRLHADEIGLTGGSRLAARVGAISADHLLRIGAAEIRSLAAAGTVATLCPVTALDMGQLPPARALLEAGVTVALGTDHNPGTSGTTRMSLIVYLAVVELKMTVAEALTAATAGGARSLALTDRGSVSAGQLADLVLWDADHEGAFAWEPGLSARAVWRFGRLVAGSGRP